MYPQSFIVKDWGFLYKKTHSLGEWFKRWLVPIMEKKLPLLK